MPPVHPLTGASNSIVEVRAEWPKVRAYTKDGKVDYHIDARSKKFGFSKQFSRRSKEAAIRLAEELAEQAATGEAITRQEKRALVFYREALGRFNWTIEAALGEKLHRLSSRLDKSQRPRILVSEAVGRWEAMKLSEVTRKLRPATIREVQGTAKLIRTNLGDRALADLSTGDLEVLIYGLRTKAGAPISHQTRHNLRNRLGGFFRWCVKADLIDSNIATGVNAPKPRSEKDPEFLAVDEVVQLLDLAQSEPKYQPVLLSIVLGLFAGIRPNEVIKLEWENINLRTDPPEIRVGAKQAKTLAARMVPIERPLLMFLFTLTDVNPRDFGTTSYRRLFEELKGKMGYKLRGNNGTKKWPPDVLRHTYATMWLAVNKDRDALAVNMGTGIQNIPKFYNGVVSQEEARRFWMIAPHDLASKAAKEAMKPRNPRLDGLAAPGKKNARLADIPAFRELLKTSEEAAKLVRRRVRSP
jgi:integrase